MRILFLTDNYPPEVNAPAVRTHFHCREWVRAGAEVTVVTCAPNFPRGEVFKGYVNRWRQREEMDGVRVIRVWSFMAPNAGFARRIVDYVSFAVTATIAALGESFDVVVATSPQFFTAVAGGTVAALKRRPWVFELRDFWPESIVATGAMRKSTVVQILERLEMALYRSADLIVPVTQAFERKLVARGIDAGKIAVVTNGVVSEEFSRAASEVPWRPETGRAFRVGYLGTHGLAHGLDLVLRTAALMESNEVEFTLVGDGADKARLVERARAASLPNVVFRDPVGRHEIPDVLAEFDACLVPLRDAETFRSVIPSKIFEAAAARRPILLGVRGQSEEIVREFGAGLPFVPEREDALVAAIRRMRDEPGLYESLQAGCERLAGAYDRTALARKMLSLLEGLRR
jgi:hypothetical protein